MNQKSLNLTLGQVLTQTANQFDAAGLSFGHGTENAYDEAAWLVLSSLGLSLQEPVRNLDMPLAVKQVKAITALAEQRINSRKPLAYLLGSAWFCGYEFLVNEDVLIPRSPIAELIDLEFSPWLQKNPLRILDLCTGSGCIAIVCAHAFPNAVVDASDISANALQVAQSNVKKHQLENRVKLILSDLFQNIAEKSDTVAGYDLIVSNPPYVMAEELSALPDEYRHEPELGLAAGDDGLEMVTTILQSAARYLSEEGLLVVEVGNSMQNLMQRFPSIPFTWVDFERGGNGVFVMSCQELQACDALCK